ncbi:MAG: phosphatidate cytidylyltransferase [Clostridia bacterium]|nr:phosphatidate cytidylyltransferase [Clostridia bacterium]
MKIRIVTAIVALCAFIPICIFSHTIVYPVTSALLACVAVWEMWHCIQKKDGEDGKENMGSVFLYIPTYIVAVGAPFLAFFKLKAVGTLSGTWHMKNAAAEVINILACSMFLLLLYYFVLAVFSKGKISIEALAVFFMMTIYIVVSFTCLVLLRNGINGTYFYLLPFVGAWISDTFAYFTGRLFGKHKLIPEVSPKKTIEGSIGGIVFTAISFVVYGIVFKKLFPGMESDYILLAVMGAAASVISQVGDLIASVIKRHYGIKDYGKLFPGHGGVMDRFDSVLATAPVVYILSVVFSHTFF